MCSSGMRDTFQHWCVSKLVQSCATWRGLFIIVWSFSIYCSLRICLQVYMFIAASAGFMTLFRYGYKRLLSLLIELFFSIKKLHKLFLSANTYLTYDFCWKAVHWREILLFFVVCSVVLVRCCLPPALFWPIYISNRGHLWR